ENAIGRDFFELGMGQRLSGIRERIDEVIRDKINIRIEELGVIDYKGEKRFLDLDIVPLIDPNGEMRGVIIISNDVTDDKNRKDELKRSNEDLQALNAKLETTNEELETTNEELVSTNEELQTTTEELQSTAEELETSNEELQSTNEELETTNEELKSANEQLETANEELRDVTEQLNANNQYNKKIIQSIDQSLIVLNRSGIITTWNPPSEEMWGLNEEDAIGRSIFTLTIGIDAEDLRQKIRQANESRTNYHEGALEYTARTGEKRLIELTIIPVIDITGKILSSMLLLQDITESKEIERVLQEAHEYAESIVETVREPLVVLDAQLRVKSVNQAFYKTFKVSPEETLNKFIYELGNGEWDIPELRKLLEEIIPRDKQIQDFKVDPEFPEIGRKTMLLNARQIYRRDIGTQMILLAIEDVTERGE
ncbi:MAG TPA: PAS domain S-box protein, partial [Candidatus Methanoperedens sp.]|nr:PAS domain S-box protein [Candidatus Methanoperedens sp.]